MVMSPRAVAAALLAETSEREVCLLTITHQSWTTPVRLSTDATVQVGTNETTGEPRFGTVSRGNVFEYVPIGAILPDSRDESPPAGKVSIDNVSRLVSPYLLKIEDEYPQVTVEVVLASTPDIVDQVWPELDMTQANLDASRAEVTLGMNTAIHEPMPWLRFSEAYFPNLFDK